jgi:DNA-binding transcriptional ArsR family regulator
MLGPGVPDHVPAKRKDGSMSEFQNGSADPTGYRLRRLLEVYYDLTLQMQDRLGAGDANDVLLLVLVAIGDLRGAPMDAELLAEKLESSRSTVERRLKPYLDHGTVRKGRRGKSVVYLFDRTAVGPQNDGSDAASKADADMTIGMVRTLMTTVFDIATD